MAFTRSCSATTFRRKRNHRISTSRHINPRITGAKWSSLILKPNKVTAISNRFRRDISNRPTILTEVHRVFYLRVRKFTLVGWRVRKRPWLRRRARADTACNRSRTKFAQRLMLRQLLALTIRANQNQSQRRIRLNRSSWDRANTSRTLTLNKRNYKDLGFGREIQRAEDSSRIHQALTKLNTLWRISPMTIGAKWSVSRSLSIVRPRNAHISL